MKEKDYNTQRTKMKLPEYGRALHNMVEHAMTIEDKEERNLAVKTIIDIMGTMYPYLRDVNDFKHKLWDHIAIMSDFKLDIDYPFEPPVPETFTSKPATVPYTQTDVNYRHYGKIIEELIEVTSRMEDSNPAKAAYVEMLANQMKKSYLVWNKDVVEDEKILDDLRSISKGRLSLPQGYVLQDVAEIVKVQQKKSTKVNQNQNNRNNRKYK